MTGSSCIQYLGLKCIIECRDEDNIIKIDICFLTVSRYGMTIF